MNLIPRHATGVSPSEQTSDLLLIAGSTPSTGWERILPLLERAGCTLPTSSMLEDWYAVARAAAALGQPGVATLNSGTQHHSLRSASTALRELCLTPILLSVEELEGHPEFWLEELPGTRLLMFHTRPEAALIAAMVADQSLEETLARWTSAAEFLLHSFRHHRRRVTLISVECALASPVEFLRSCKVILGLQPLPYSAMPTPHQYVGSDMQRLIAAQTVAQSPYVSQLILELDACSLPIGEPIGAPYVDCIKIYAAQREDREFHNTVKHDETLMAAMVKERDELARQLDQVREEFQVIQHERKATVDTELSRVNEKLKVLVAERELHLQSIENLTRERDAQVRKISEFDTRAKALDDDIQLRMKLIHECEAKLKATEKARREVGQENDLLTLQLHQAQEELESYYLSLQSASAKAVEAEKRAEGLEKNLRNMKNSRSWKITAPLRKIMKLFSR